MYLDPAADLYVFEVILGFRANGKTHTSPPCVVQADDPEEAEDEIMEYLCNMDLDQDFLSDQMSDPFSIQDYPQKLKEDLRESLPLLDELNDEEWRDFLGFLYSARLRRD
jgi:hypothetical protein